MNRPWAYYNEFEPYAAEWIENLIRLGVVAPGIVDRRSIEDVRPDDLRGFRQCHFFAGIAVWSYALRRAGVSDDTALWTGSCPCQPFSAAGQGGGVDDERHLWPAFHHLIAECRPERVYGEQVASKDGLGWLDLVQTDMEAAGYAIGAVDTCSAGSGAPHIRQRLRFYAHDLRSAADGMEHASGFGRDERWTEPSERSAVGGCESGELADTLRNGQSRSGVLGRSGDSKAQEDWKERRIVDVCWSGRLADTHGGDAGTEGLQRSGEYGQQQEDSGIVRLEHSSSSGRDDRPTPERQQDQHGLGIANASRVPQHGAGPTNGFWRDADWLFCRDGKWRPVVAEHVEMVDGLAAAVGPGSTVCEDEDDARTRLQSLFDTFGEEEIQRQAGGSWSVRETDFLRSILHGGLDGRPDARSDGTEQPAPVSEDRGSGMRDLRSNREEVPCSSSGRESDEQRTVELDDVVRLLSQSLSFAQLWGRRQDAHKLSLLRTAIYEAGSLLHPSVSLQEVWASLGEEAKNRIRLGFDAGAWRRVVSIPLVDGREFRRGSGHPLFEGKSRQGMLKAYGNAIDAEATVDFIEATLEHRTIDLADSSLADLLA